MVISTYLHVAVKLESAMELFFTFGTPYLHPVIIARNQNMFADKHGLSSKYKHKIERKAL